MGRQKRIRPLGGEEIGQITENVPLTAQSWQQATCAQVKLKLKMVETFYAIQLIDHTRLA